MTNKKNIDPLDYLCFTAVAANSTVQLNKVGEPNDISLEISRDKKTWTPYNWTWNDESDHSLGATGDTITLSNIGDKVYWRERTLEGYVKGLFSKDVNNYFHFESEQALNCSGNIMSLLDRTLVLNTVPLNAFYHLFRAGYAGQNVDILTAPKLPAVEVSTSGYRYMFLGTSVVSVKVDGTIFGASACASLCSGCKNLTYMEVSHTEWVSNRWTYFLLNVGANGTFVCPAALDTVNLPSNTVIPETWTIKKKGYYSNSKFYNDTELTTESVLTEGEYYIDIPTEIEYYYDGSDLTPTQN